MQQHNWHSSSQAQGQKDDSENWKFCGILDKKKNHGPPFSLKYRSGFWSSSTLREGIIPSLLQKKHTGP